MAAVGPFWIWKRLSVILSIRLHMDGWSGQVWFSPTCPAYNLRTYWQGYLEKFRKKRGVIELLMWFWGRKWWLQYKSNTHMWFWGRKWWGYLQQEHSLILFMCSTMMLRFCVLPKCVWPCASMAQGRLALYVIMHSKSFNFPAPACCLPTIAETITCNINTFKFCAQGLCLCMTYWPLPDA